MNLFPLLRPMILLVGLAVSITGCTSGVVRPAVAPVAARPSATTLAARPAPTHGASATSAQALGPQPHHLSTIPVPGRPYRTLAFKPVTGYTASTLTTDGRVLLLCLIQAGSAERGICTIDPATGKQQLVVPAPAGGGQLGAAVGSGAWIVYARLDSPQRVLAQNLVTNEQIEVGRITAERVSSPVGPAYAIAGTNIVWVDEAKQADETPVETVKLFDLRDRTTRDLATLAPSFVVDQISIADTMIAWSQVDVHDAANVTSNVHVYQLETGQQQALTQDGRASMPAIFGPYVVWKTTASRFAYGSIYLYNLTTGAGQEIAHADPHGQPMPTGYDMPSIGARGVTWLSALNERILLYHPEDGTTETVDHGGGKALTAGNYLIWINDSVTRRGDWHLLWSDLAAPSDGHKR